MKRRKNNGQNNGHRRRLPREAMLARDAQIWAMHLARMTPAEIGDELGLARQTVGRSIERSEKRHRETEQLRADAAAMGAPEHVLDQLVTDLACEDVTSPEQIAQLNDLEYHRLRYLRDDHPVRALWQQAVANGYHRPKPPPTTYPVQDDGIGSWRERVSGTSSPADDGW